ncbi:TetR/AcrR family transcriptional regulator [Glutamicibacter creatinolyticus]|uniref:TetR/AcrR family transcriptional regulator n=1 Tax=Glutamicibacter creatinolyticus TaxID=162496 RepID=UPI00321769D9
MSTSPSKYHHGDLREALVNAAREMLEAGEPYSMRAVARRAGVSPAAPYRHFADREALDSAVAVEGFAELGKSLTQTLSAHSRNLSAPGEVLADLGVSYVAFALRHPALFRLMFGNECDTADSDRVRASQALHDVLNKALAALLPTAASPELSTALWALAHGLAFLHLDGKYRPEPEIDVARRVRASILAIVPATQS